MDQQAETSEADVRASRWPAVRRTAVMLLLGVIVAAAGWHGWQVRKAAWDYFAPGRHRYDIWRNYYFGTMALRHGLLNFYEDHHANPPANDKYRMNYPTMRTAVFAAWAWWNGEPGRTPHDREPVWEEGLEFNAFLHYFNCVIALLGAVAAGLLVWQWTRTPRGPPFWSSRPGWRAWPWVAAVLAFALYWYNPAGLLLAHGWPSPNAWVIPFYLWALLLISWEWWFVGGLIIGVGTMFQGQHLLVAPFFVLWALLAGQPKRAGRWAVGFGLGFTLILAPAMLTYRLDMTQPQRLLNWSGMIWIVTGALAIVMLPILRGRLSKKDLPPSRRRLVLATIGSCAVLLLAWPALPLALSWPMLAMGIVCGAVTVVLSVWWWSGSAARYVLPGVIAAQLLMCMPLFGASSAWWHIGFLYGTERHPQLAVGPANNLGALLQAYGYKGINDTAFDIPADMVMGYPAEAKPVSLRAMMGGIYAISLLLAAGATALQWRRRDPNFLLAATVPWLLFALLPAQMHDRYLGFAGLAASVWIGAAGGIGWALLGLFVSAVAYGQTTLSMTYRMSGVGGPFFDQDFFAIVRKAHPGISWALLLAAAVVLYAAFTRARPKGDKAPEKQMSASPDLETSSDTAYCPPLAAPTGPVV